MTTWQRDPRVLWRRSGGRRILALPDLPEVTVIEGTGGVIWDLLAEPQPEPDLVEALAGAFDVEAAVVQSQVMPFLDQLCALGAVQRR